MAKKYFISIGGLAQAIYDGKDVRTVHGYKVVVTPTKANKPTVEGIVNMLALLSSNAWKKYYEEVPTDWIESVSEENPKLCYVSDLSEKDAIENKIMGLVTKYSKESTLPFRVEYVGWKHAVPVPKEEVLKWLVNNEE